MNYSDAIAKFEKFRTRYDMSDNFAEYLDFELDSDTELIESLLAEHKISIEKQEKRENAILANVDSLTETLETFLIESIYKDLVISETETVEIIKNNNIDNMIKNAVDYTISNLSLVARLASKQSQILQISNDLLKVYTTSTNIKVKCSTINSKVTFNTHFLRDLTHSADECIEKHHDIKHTLKKLLQLNMLNEQAVEMLSEHNLLKDKSAITFAKLSKLTNLTEFLNLLCYSLNKYSYELASRNCFEQVIILDSITYKM